MKIIITVVCWSLSAFCAYKAYDTGYSFQNFIDDLGSVLYVLSFFVGE